MECTQAKSLEKPVPSLRTPSAHPSQLEIGGLSSSMSVAPPSSWTVRYVTGCVAQGPIGTPRQYYLIIYPCGSCGTVCQPELPAHRHILSGTMACLVRCPGKMGPGPEGHRGAPLSPRGWPGSQTWKKARVGGPIYKLTVYYNAGPRRTLSLRVRPHFDPHHSICIVQERATAVEKASQGRGRGTPFCTACHGVTLCFPGHGGV